MEQIKGYVERITFQNDENGYVVAQLQEPSKKELTCIVGNMPGLSPGESAICTGEWKIHPTHGRQFEVSTFQIDLPADAIGIQKYLGSGLIKGIGPKYAEKIVAQFGVNTLKIIDEKPEKLLDVPGLGKKRIEAIVYCWKDQRAIRDVMVFLQSYDVSPLFAQKIYKTYGNQSVTKVKENPFRLARDLFGIGFKTADNLAKKMGIAPDSPLRIDAGIEYLLLELAGEGHTCYPVEHFLKKIHEVFEVSEELIQERLPKLHEEGRIVLKELVEKGEKRPFVWLSPLFSSECGIVRELKRLQSGLSSLRSIQYDKAIEWVQSALKIELAANQSKAVESALKQKLQIITGGPGTGKSTITNAILKIAEKLTHKIILAAPTGRAAKRMSEITGQHAKTIHSLLSYDFKKAQFKHNKENPLDCDLIVIDEASMIDTYLMYSLLKAIPDHSKVIFVGDADQLPSVGPGNILKDMIHSLCVPSIELTEIFRQAAGSQIITNAHKVNKGIFPQLYNGQESDFFFIEAQEPEEIVTTLIKIIAQRLPNKYGFNIFKDIQVLTPMKRGIIGTENLNQVLQARLNPKEVAIFKGGRRFHEHDKVMQLRNNYKKDVYNGDIGFIESIDNEEQQCAINYEGKVVTYEFSELDELSLAYAISIHKSQGTEAPCIIIPVHTSHFLLLHRNLLYTAITRGKKVVVLVGSKKAIAIAVNNDTTQKRYTSLQQTLMEFF